MNLSAEALRIAALKMLADDETGILNESKLRSWRNMPAYESGFTERRHCSV